MIRSISIILLAITLLLAPYSAEAKKKQAQKIAPAPAPAAEPAEGKDLYLSGQYEKAAKWFINYIQEHPNDNNLTPPALMQLGKSLEKMSEGINTPAEKECFRTPSAKIKDSQCMNMWVERLNSTYGAGSFGYSEQMPIITYTGSHYKRIVAEFPTSSVAPEADYLILLSNLKGSPDVVLPRIKEFLAKYKDGEWSRKGLLLWSRVNEDIWWIYKNWSFLLSGGNLTQKVLTEKIEGYKQEALKGFQELITKAADTDEGRVAKEEYALLKSDKDDGKFYGIVDEGDLIGIKNSPPQK